MEKVTAKLAKELILEALEIGSSRSFYPDNIGYLRSQISIHSPEGVVLSCVTNKSDNSVCVIKTEKQGPHFYEDPAIVRALRIIRASKERKIKPVELVWVKEAFNKYILELEQRVEPDESVKDLI